MLQNLKFEISDLKFEVLDPALVHRAYERQRGTALFRIRTKINPQILLAKLFWQVTRFGLPIAV